MAEPAGSAASGEDRFVVFMVGGRSLALPAERVREIMRVPSLQRVPQAPRALLGLMNLRGTVLPVVDLAGNGAGPGASDAARILVVDAGAPLGLMTEGMAALAAGRREGTGESGKTVGFSDGLARLRDGSVAHIVALDRLLAESFPQFGRRPIRTATAEPASADSISAGDQTLPLVMFEVSGQDYALPLDRVAEIVPLPAHLASVPHTDDHILGVVPLRDGLLALVSTALLLGLPTRPFTPDAKVVVTRVHGTRAGLVVDRIRSIVQVDERRIDPVPALLRTDGAEIQAICRLDGGRRLVSVLSTEGLFNEAVMRRIASEGGQAGTDERASSTGAADGEQFVLFRLGEDLFGLPVRAVEEVVRVPDNLTRLPRAPSFVEGIMNLRGSALPVLDQRRRFDLPPAPAGTSRRIVVLSFEGTRAGFIVDQVTDVRRFPTSVIVPAPEVAEDQARIVPRVAMTDGDGMVLLIDPRGLLDTTEKRLLAAISRDQKARPAA
jgi:purine-binding chemotaxis protein CheW